MANPMPNHQPHDFHHHLTFPCQHHHYAESHPDHYLVKMTIPKRGDPGRLAALPQGRYADKPWKFFVVAPVR
jgi:hypothetical protein